ncbi:WS/DGAT domain-containing protein [Mycobacterium marinum]|uniref:WS/DGAT domain-containing protein n=1 Tax=Mycobacterium marinum TaxID=1781 RepID=UPI0035669E06
MAAHPMAAVDAQFYWMSAKMPNDQFLLYAFDGRPAEPECAIDQLVRRARACPELRMRVHDGAVLTYPRWLATDVGSEQVVRHNLDDDSWHGCLAAVVGLAREQLDIRLMSWRAHVFAPVSGIPGVQAPGTVVVVQVAHALGDGVRASALAARLFGRRAPIPSAEPRRRGFLPRGAADAVCTHRRLVRDTEAGLLAPGAGSRPLRSTNAKPEGARELRTLVRHRSQICGPTVTVAVLAAVSAALSRLPDGNAEQLGAEVPMAKPGLRQANNHFGNIVVGLYPQLERGERMHRIAADLANARRRMQHPAASASDLAFARVPAALLRWGVSQFDADMRPDQVAGNTVVSSVHRGAADLSFGEAPVVLTAGYPALSPLMGLTHGVHGIGDTIAVSVHAAQSAVADIDSYLELLDQAL